LPILSFQVLELVIYNEYNAHRTRYILAMPSRVLDWDGLGGIGDVVFPTPPLVLPPDFLHHIYTDDVLTRYRPSH
jgi:hypothetical protein